MLGDLAEEAVHERHDLIGPLGGKAVDVVDEAGDVVAVAVAEDAHGRHAAGVVFVGLVPFRRHRGAQAVHHLQGRRRRQHHLFPGVGHHFIGQEDHRGAVFFRQVEGA